ncbi:MAG: diacylglycerol kinase family lipid kinase [Alphaproteobacteria bacterium]|nr:diacylglycerol kinase family lipid kinase [Alphaproteobacteria bacterium]
MRRQILIIVNPAAGRRRTFERRLGRFVAALERQGCSVVLRRAGPSPGEVERLAREAERGFDAIVAAGGDGTVNAVVNGLQRSQVAVGVLPLGTANVLARELGLPRNPEQLAGLVAAGRVSPVWSGRIGNRAFAMMASAGFDSEIVAAVRPGLKRRIGWLAFVFAILVRLCRYRASALVVRADGLEYRVAGVVAAKGRYYAGPFVVAPGAKLSEPTLELVLLRAGGRFAVLRYAIALGFGLIAHVPGITILRVREALVFGEASLPVQADGEIVGRLPVTIGVADKPLLLIQPG